MEDSSNQNVFWGPVTINEIKKLLSYKKPPEAISRRASICNDEPSRTIYSDSPTTDYLIKKQFFDNAGDELYAEFTPETLRSNATKCCVQNYDGNNENFVEKVCKALNLDSSYVSAAEFSSQETPKDITKASEISEESSELEATRDSYITADSHNSFETQMCQQLNKNFSKISNKKSENNPSVTKMQSQPEVEEQANEDDLNKIPAGSTSSPAADDQNNVDMSDKNHSFEDINQSDSSSSDYEFNDTLEEMELALRFGLDYTMPDDLELDNSDVPMVSDLEEPPQHSLEASPSKQACENVRAAKTKIPRPIQNVHKKSQDLEFKIPSTPLSTRHKTPDFRKVLSPIAVYIKTPRVPQVQHVSTPALPKGPLFPKQSGIKNSSNIVSATRHKTPDCKNVLSPIAVYLKNSPRVPQVQHISGTALPKGPLFPKQSGNKNSNKENAEKSLPIRIYKPAKSLVASKEKELKLPLSIQKHLPNLPDVIKHSGRIGARKKDSTIVETKLLNEDLTMSYSVLNSSEASHEISLITTKKSYIT